MATAILTQPTTQHLMTVDEFWDFCQLPENQGQSYELVRGKVIPMCRPTTRHGFVCAVIGTELNLYGRARKLGFATTNDSGVVLFDDPGTVVGPDVAFHTNIPRYADMPERWSDTLPVLAVEVLSPTDRWSRVQTKIQDYLEAGVPLVWLADPDEKSITVYRLKKRVEVFRCDQEITGGEELPGFTCKVADLFFVPGEALPPTT